MSTESKPNKREPRLQPEQPSHEEVIAALLEVALLIPENQAKTRKQQKRPAWLNKAYQRTFRDDICKEIAAVAASPSSIEPFRYGSGPLLIEPERERLVAELVDAAPIPPVREDKIDEVIRLSGIHMLQKPNFSNIFDAPKRLKVLKNNLMVFSDEELNEQIKNERRRVATDALMPVIRGLVF